MNFNMPKERNCKLITSKGQEIYTSFCHWDLNIGPLIFYFSSYRKSESFSEIRRRYCKAFVKVMKALCRKLGTEEYTKALSQFSQEQPNLQKLLTEVYHSTNETYPFFIKVASDCTELIERFMASKSDIILSFQLNDMR